MVVVVSPLADWKTTFCWGSALFYLTVLFHATQMFLVMGDEANFYLVTVRWHDFV